MPVVTLDFDAVDYPVSGGDFAFHNGPIFEDGFAVQNLNPTGTTDFGTLRSSSIAYNRHDSNDDVPYVTNVDPATGRAEIFVTIGGKPFDLISLQLDTLTPTPGGSVTLRGVTSTLIAVTTTVSLDDVKSLQTFLLDPTFRDLIELTIDGPANFQFNDIIVRGYVTGTAGADTFVATGGDDHFKGLNGDDLFRFGSSFDDDDIVDGGNGQDTLELRGNYTLVQDPAVSITNISRVETIRLVSGSDITNYPGGNPNDRFNYSLSFADPQLAGTTALTIDASGLLSSETLTFTAAAELTGRYTVLGGAGADSITTGAGNDTLTGGAGGDVLDGGLGTNQLTGNAGDDTYIVRGGSDVIVEQAGGGSADRVVAYASYALGAGVDVEIMSTFDPAAFTPSGINLTGNALTQQITGNAGFNHLDSGGGGDTMSGLAGDDWYVVRAGSDQVREALGEGIDQVFVHVDWTLGADDHVEYVLPADRAGTSGIDVTGNQWRQTVYGNAGANILDGKGSPDTLVGLGGADIFAFTSALGVDNIDTIFDFAAGVDKIGFAGVTAAQLQAGAFRVGAAAQDADDRIIYDQATGNLYYDGDGNGAGAQILFAILNGAPVLTANDFVTI